MERRSYDVRIRDGSVRVEAWVREVGVELLICLHGLGCSSETFRDVWEYPDFDAYSILCPDLPGFGESDAPTEFSYSMEDHALVCSEILSKHRFDRLHLVGHSMGGAIGLLLPDSTLASVDSFANVEGNLNSEDCVFGSRRASAVPFERFVSDVLPEFRQSSETWQRNGLDSTSEIGFYKSAKSLVEWSDSGDLLRAFQELSCRKTYIYGEQNGDHPTVDSVQGITRLEISAAGHFAMNDNPDDFYKGLAEFVRHQS